MVSPFWRVWFYGWCVSMLGFAVVMAVGALDGFDAPFRILMALLNFGEPVPITPVLRFVSGILGGVLLGWIVALSLTLRVAMAMGHAGRPLWLACTLGLIAWYALDSTLSVATGFGLNVVPNTLALGMFLIGIAGSKVLTREA